MNLDFVRVCGKHNLIYEAYYKQIDPKGTGAIEAMTAAKFLKKSGLSDVVLSRIWDLSDPNGKGFLDKPGFFVALKLVSLSQAGQVANMNNIYMDTVQPPKVGDIPKAIPSRMPVAPVAAAGGGASGGDWTISVIDRLKYEQLFESLNPHNGMLPGNKVKGVLMDSKLPMNILGTIWDLADQDKDGNLDKHEFIVAMHLVYQTLQKRTVPSVLPPELRKAPKPAMPPPPNVAAAGHGAAMPRAPSGEGFGDGGFVANFPKDIAPPAAIPPLPVAVPPMTRIPPVGAVSSQPLIQTDPLIPIGAPPSVTANADWVVSSSELLRFEEIFRQSDLDKDGLVSGLEVKDIFIKSGIPQRSLADIWALCDTNQSGKLTVEQFALAMWLVERKQRGVDPPQVLTANMVPPSMRAIVSGVDVQQQEPKPTYSNPELEMISKEIEELARERRALETEIAQKEADVRIKNGEVRSLQSELDTLTATLKQLENQRGEAQKRLDDLQAQVTQNLAVLANVSHDITYTNAQVNKIRDQCHKQEETINEQEGELNAKRSELQKLKDEESALQKEYDNNNNELSKLTKHLQNTQLQISSVRSMVTQLMETQRQMTDALLICRAAMENQNAELVSEYQLKIEPDFDDARKTLEKEVEIPKDDPFDENNSGAANKATNGFDNDPFSGQGSKPTPAIKTGFDDSFNMSSNFDSGFDAFGQSGASGFGQTTRDPFGADAFAANKPSAITPEPGKDDFGSDPFAALHAPTGQGQVLSPNTNRSGPPPRPESPSPALPPKKSKVPPPRPAPPRASQPSSGFGSSAAGGGGFADFDDFDNKLQNIPIKNQNTTTTTTPIPSISSTLLDSFSLFDDPLSKNLRQSPSIAASTTTPTSALSLTQPQAQPLHSPSTLLLTSSIATLTSASATAATASNPHLSRSNTPLQTQQDTALSAGLFDAFGSGSVVDKKAPTPVPVAATVQGPTDFKDDPFKDYRYEDPFNIKDPFADEDTSATGSSKKNFSEDFSSEDELPSKTKSKAATPLNNELLQQFDAFNLNASPAPSHHSTASNPKQSQLALDAFADFDDFVMVDKPATGNASELTLTAPSPDSRTTLTSNNNANANNKLNDSFFNAFNDNFNDNQLDPMKTDNNKTKGLLNEPTNPKLQASTTAFDAFAVSSSGSTTTTTTESKLFDAFNDNFDDSFSNNKPANSATALDNNFAKFDAFDAHNFSSDFGQAFDDSNANKSKQHNGNVSSKINKELSQGKKTDKFASDYSKPESYDADLEEALKRSMMDN
ncbi:epidermal growth factor receptor substrate 15-like 1 isoform X1 [Drosophila nasuta]|uniref:epidermal growth factor receptor substrate 15-like 1 isoform X1 n=2 Tax=Drosophila nasuta TaxID=42062 RepID=UPI00295F20DF|nr:epidermal growth factor receptor substrate 15-like 1 isoform X1 [Drosophila nasuta]